MILVEHGFIQAKPILLHNIIWVNKHLSTEKVSVVLAMT